MVKCVKAKDLIHPLISLPYAVYLSGSLLVRPRNASVSLASGKRTLATSMLLVSRNRISFSDVAALTNASYSGP